MHAFVFDWNFAPGMSLQRRTKLSFIWEVFDTHCCHGYATACTYVCGIWIIGALQVYGRVLCAHPEETHRQTPCVGGSPKQQAEQGVRLEVVIDAAAGLINCQGTGQGEY